ncbi:Cyclic nucleotide-binding protein [Pseudocohnilembus persalinus]|uniref:Cyclic nucleotide-binding protein n=1 Tax=Pseudocohnilembus persalinus TaxID=266149 RepID=A0A0V0QMP8_PSEPJ|nr:Cyclic nucleotide-binding protein [Pseudocohnilembus persalinus]|eukprot:KRX03510.1 Cyclic nucleotide-binding protein [Pseudocohnilembus persalinus]
MSCDRKEENNENQCEPQYPKKKEAIFLEGDYPIAAYIIKKGTFSLYKELMNIGEVQNNGVEDIQKDNQNKFLNKKNNIIYKCVKVIEKQMQNIRIKYIEQFTNFLQICEIINGEIFGQEDIIDNSCRSYSIVCESEEAEIYKIKREDLILKFIAQKDRSLLQMTKKQQYFINQQINIVSNSNKTHSIYLNQHKQNLQDSPLKKIKTQDNIYDRDISPNLLYLQNQVKQFQDKEIFRFKEFIQNQYDIFIKNNSTKQQFPLAYKVNEYFKLKQQELD